MPIESSVLISPKHNDEVRRCPRNEAVRDGQQWVHDLYNPSQSAPPHRPRDLRETDSSRPPSRVRQYDLDSYRPSPIASASHTPAGKEPQISTPNGPSAYMSLRNLMQEKAKAIGVSANEYAMAQGRLIQQVQQQLPNRDVNPSWIQWKAESMIWSHFFGSVKFPNQEPAMSIVSTPPQAGINVVSTTRLPSTETYASCWRSIEHR